MLTRGQSFTLVVDLAAALVVAWIGLRLLREPGEGVARRARTRFAVWWLGLAADQVINVGTWLLYALGVTAPALIAALTYLALACVCVMLWGLVSYLLYLFTGRAGALAGATWLYALSFAGGAALIASLAPDGVTLSEWGGAIRYVHQPSAGTALGFAIAFLLPPFLGALAYASLLPRVREPSRRWRVALVSGSVLAWFGASLATAGAGEGRGPFVTLAVAILAIAGLVAAYSPPAFVRARWGIRRLGDPELARPEGMLVREERGPRRAKRAREMRERIQDLV